MSRPLSEQIVVITGASSGIGRATAIQFASRRATVVLAARSEGSLEEVARICERLGGKAHVVVTDVADFLQVQRLVNETIERFGRVDTLVNNAAVSEYANVEQMSADEIDRILAVDLHGPIYCCKAVIPFMKQSGGGTIINIGSGFSERAFPLQSIYSAAKHGLKGFTEALRLELRHDQARINVTLVLPSAINTPFYDHARNKTGHRPQPAGPIYQPEAVAEAIVFAAQHPRRDIFVGAPSKLLAIAEHLTPSLVDKVLSHNGYAYRAQLSDNPDGQPDNLFQPPNEPSQSHGRFDDRAHLNSFYTRLFQLRPAIGRLLIAALALTATQAFQHIARPQRHPLTR